MIKKEKCIPKFNILTLFPEIFSAFLSLGIFSRGIKKGVFSLEIDDLRAFSSNPRGRVDDRPYGGGDGMVLSVEPIARALAQIKKKGDLRPVIFLTPQGKRFNQKWAMDLAQGNGAIFLCGRYGGIDERIRENWVDEELSIGDYVLMGGELAAMVVLEASVRLIPGVLGNEESSQNDSFKKDLLEGPQYTRPREYQGLKVPSVLLSGHHQNIANWQQKQSLTRTQTRRPDLIMKRNKNHKTHLDSEK